MLLEEEAREILMDSLRTGRELTPEESAKCKAAVERANVQKQIAKLDPGAQDVMPDGATTRGGLGDQFVSSASYKALSDETRPQRWTTGAVQVSSTPIQTKAGTLFESGQGAGFVATPQVIPGIVSKLFEPLTVASLLPSEQAHTSSLRYIVEGTATSGAAGVAEGGEKPASDFAYSTVDEPVKKIATTLTISDELFSDAPSVQSYLNSRLSLFVRIEEDRQILRGAGTNELVGLFDRGINTYARGTVDNNAVAIFKAAMGTRGSSNLDPDAIIMHPDNWRTTRLLMDANDQFYGGGPFSAAYGGPQGPAGVFSNSLWNMPVVLSTVVGSGTALLGSFGAAARIYRRGGVTLEATNSHSTHFVHDLVTIRAEQREALACFRPGAFTEVVDLT